MKMRFSPLLLAAVATAAVAQTSDPAPAPAPEQSRPGLTDLQGTVQELQDQRPAPAVPRAAPPAARPPETPPRRPAATSAPPPLIQSEIAELNRVSQRGLQLIAITRAGIIATQDLLSRVPNPASAGIDGWVAETEGASMTVTFFDNADDGPRVVYRATVQGPRVVSRDTFLGTHRPAMPRALARLATARAAVEALNHTACSPQGFNYLVLPPAAPGGPIHVYEVSAPTQRGRYPAGGHFRTSVNGNGDVGESHAFASGCSDITVTEPPAGQQPPPVPIAAGPDPWPTEIHVLMSQMSGRALTFSAGTPTRQWLVAGTRIAEVRDGAPRFVTAQERSTPSSN